MVLGVGDDFRNRELQLDASPLAQAALEDRQLQPLAIPVLQTENAAPTARVADVVGDDIEVLPRTTPPQRAPVIGAVAARNRGSIAGSPAISPITCRPSRRVCTSRNRR